MRANAFQFVPLHVHMQSTSSSYKRARGSILWWVAFDTHLHQPLDKSGMAMKTHRVGHQNVKIENVNVKELLAIVGLFKNIHIHFCIVHDCVRYFAEVAMVCCSEKKISKAASHLQLIAV